MGQILLAAQTDGYVFWLSLILCSLGFLIIFQHWKKKK